MGIFDKLFEKRKVVKNKNKEVNYTNSIGMEFTLIPAGEFMMGSEEQLEPQIYMHTIIEKPHRVNISKPFYLGTYPVTQKEWRAVVGNNPSHFKGDNLPVECVSWDDVQEFIKKLNGKENTNKYRLPSEAEWEYAARAGTTTRYSFGDDESKLRDYAWYHENSGGKTHDVGQKKPNPWGLYDMYGNVWEWVQDIWYRYYLGTPADSTAREGNVSQKIPTWDGLIINPADGSARIGDVYHRVYRGEEATPFTVGHRVAPIISPTPAPKQSASAF